MMKKLAFVTLVAMASSGAYAATACSNGDSTALTGGGADDFIKVATVPVQCSANSYVDYQQDATSFAVASMSGKGKSTFRGNSNGGGVVKHADCAATVCADGDLSAALAEAAGGGSS